jgi:DNA-binding IclR family transcriptional regulator
MNKKTDNEKRYLSSTPAVEQAAEVLKYLASEKGIKAGLTEIARKVDIPKTKVNSILNALQIAGFITKDKEGTVYSLGSDIIPIGLRALENIDYRTVAKPSLEQLAKDTKCTVLFGVITSKKLLIISKAISGQEVDSRLDVGFVADVFYQAHGKAIFVSLPQREQERLLSGPDFMGQYDRGLIKNSQLRKEIAEIKKKGFTVNDGRVNRIIKVLTAAVVGSKNYPIGALIVIGLMQKSAISKYGAKLVETARNLSLVLGASN